MSLGKTRTQKKSEAKLEKFLTKTIGASGTLEKGGRRVKLKALKGFSKDKFRKSKLESTRIVQRKEKRLAAKSEVFGLQSAKMKRFKKESFFN